MKLTKEQFVECLNTYEIMYNQETEILNALAMFDPDWVCGRWLNNYYNLLTDLCEFENDDFEQMYGTDLDWYCWETQFGKSNTTITYNAGDKGLIINVNTPEKLYEFIVAKQGK